MEKRTCRPYADPRQTKKMKFDTYTITNLRNIFARNASITFDDNTQSFRVGTRVVPGLTKKLRAVFWPDYEYQKPPKAAGNGKRARRDIFGGLDRGKIVHNQLRMHINGATKNEFRSQFVAWHPYTKNAVDALQAWKLTPIIAEFPVVDDGLNIATAADALCVNDDGQLVLVEFKTGMSRYFDLGNAGMHNTHGVGKLNNCPRNQAHMQLLFTKMMLEYTHNLRIAEAFVIQIRDDDVVRYRLPKTLQKNAANLRMSFEAVLSNIAYTKRLQKKR